MEPLFLFPGAGKALKVENRRKDAGFFSNMKFLLQIPKNRETNSIEKFV